MLTLFSGLLGWLCLGSLGLMVVYKNGPRRAVQTVPGSSVNAGDVIVQGNLTLISDQDNPLSPSLSIVQQNLYVGGVYQANADAAYSNGTYVWWNTSKQQVTTTYVSGVTYPFGWIVAGPQGLVSDGGPTGSGIACYVDHDPEGLVTPAPPQQLLANFRNKIDGGDFTTNPWQRGTSQAADITNTLTYGPDRFFMVAGASSAIDWSQVADATLAGFNQCWKVQRKAANTDVTAIKIGQVLESADSIALQGQVVTLSFYAKAGANYSGGSLTVAINHSTTSGNDTAAHLVAASTNWQATPTIVNATQAITSGWVRYQFVGTVPAGATQLGLLITWTPTGTAGADDSISFQGFQLEVGAGASPFEHRDVEVELALCQRYYMQFNEVNGAVFAVGAPTGTNTQSYSIWLPTPMRVAPTVTVTVGGFKVIVDGGAAAAATGLTTGTAHSNTIITLNSTVTLSAAAHSILLQGSGTTGVITASAEF